MISRVTASGSGMCGVLAFVFIFFSNQFLAHVSAGSNISCSFRALYF